MCIPTRTRLTYNNDKPWFTAKLRQLRQAKEDAYRKRDKQAKYTLEKEIRVTKRNYSGKLRNKISSSDSASVWKGLKDIINYKTPSPSTVENQQLADYFNDFYCRFGQTGCVLSPLLFSLYTNERPTVKLLKFADDTTLIGIIQDGDESAYRQEVKELAV